MFCLSGWLIGCFAVRLSLDAKGVTYAGILRDSGRERESKSTYVLPRKPLIVELMATNTRYDSRRAEGGHPALPPAYAKEATVCVQTASTDKVKLLSQTSSARDTDQ